MTYPVYCSVQRNFACKNLVWQPLNSYLIFFFMKTNQPIISKPPAVLWSTSCWRRSKQMILADIVLDTYLNIRMHYLVSQRAGNGRDWRRPRPSSCERQTHRVQWLWAHDETAGRASATDDSRSHEGVLSYEILATDHLVIWEKKRNEKKGINDDDCSRNNPSSSFSKIKSRNTAERLLWLKSETLCKILNHHNINTHCSKACRDNAKVLCETADEVKVAQFPVNVVLSVTRHTWCEWGEERGRGSPKKTLCFRTIYVCVCLGGWLCSSLTTASSYKAIWKQL